MQEQAVPTIQESIPSTDKNSNQQTIYEASMGQIFARQFLAGASRALGGVVVYLIFLAVMGYLASMYIWPILSPFLTTFNQSMQLLQSPQVMPFTVSATPNPNPTVIQPGTTYTLPSDMQVDQLYQLYQQFQPAPSPQP